MVEKVRLYQLSKELGISNRELLRFLRELGVKVKSHSSTIDEETAQAVKDLVEEERRKEGVPPAPPVEERRPTPLEAKKVAEKPLLPPPVEKAPPKPKEEKVLRFSFPPTVAQLAEAMSMEGTDLVAELFRSGVVAPLTQALEWDIAERLAAEHGYTLLREEVEVVVRRREEEEMPPEREGKKVPVPPVVTVLGHVDHGKTTLLDAIRNTNVASQEVGGITQSIGAYEVEIEEGKITFIDTPGHEAFTAMRARGAQVTHLVVLVVAADDGVMPQTVEAINHARAAGVPIVVAINKIDKPEADVERAMRQLAEQRLIPEEWGGDTVCVPVSALRRQNLDMLLEMVLLVADLLEIKADPTGPAEGTVIESKKDPAKGPVATVIVQKGTLKAGDWVVVGSTYGRVRVLLDWQGQPVKEAGPSKPVEVVGLEEVPRAGDKLRVAGSRKEALEMAERAREGRRAPAGVALEALAAGEERELRLVIKGSTQGAVEAARKALEQLDSEEIGIKVVHAGVGDVNESDVMLASASKGMVVGFGVSADHVARKAAEDEGVSIRTYEVIYDLIDDIEAAMLGMLEPEIVEESLGRAEVRALFRTGRYGVAAGCFVTEGRLVKGKLIRVLRDGKAVWEGSLSSLRRFKEDVSQVMAGLECGVAVERFDEFKVGDIIECFDRKEVRKTELTRRRGS